MSRGRGLFGVEQVKRLLIVSALPVLVSGCGLGSGRITLSRHPQEAVVCEGPREAYEVDPFPVQARSAGGGPAASSGFKEESAVPGPPPASVLLHLNPMAVMSGPEGWAHRLNQAWCRC
jgi:hypothetical protein